MRIYYCSSFRHIASVLLEKYLSFVLNSLAVIKVFPFHLDVSEPCTLDLDDVWTLGSAGVALFSFEVSKLVAALDYS